MATAAADRDGQGDARAGAPATDSSNMLAQEVLDAAVQEVADERDALQEELDGAQRTIRLQHIAAKGLGIFYCMELHSLRRQCREYEEEVAKMAKKRKMTEKHGWRRMSIVLREQSQGLEVVLKQL